MNSGLRYLLAKGPRVVVRQLRRRFRGGRGILALVGIAFLIVLFVAPQIVRYTEFHDAGRFRDLAPTIRLIGPAMLVLLALATAMRGGLYFKPADIQFLFPAPIGRRELLVYDVLSKFRVQLLSGLWVSIFAIAYAKLWYAAVIGVILALALLQLGGQTIGLILVAVEERFGSAARRLTVLAFWAVLGSGIAFAAVGATGDGGLLAILERFARFAPIALLSWITRSPVEVFIAESFMRFTLWTMASIGVMALLVGLMAVLDVAYSEGAVERAQKIQARIARIRSGGGAFAAAGPSRGRIRVPPLPYWNGAGPVAWRQLQELTRNYRAALMMGVLVLLFVGMFLFMPSLADRGNNRGPEMPAIVPLIMLLVIAPMMTTNSAFDFRRDLDRMTLLKSYPLSGFALAAGQVIPTTLLVTAWEYVAIVIIACTGSAIAPSLLIAIAISLLPLNAILIAFDNFLFLKLPYRIVARDPGRIPFMPRLMLVMFLKMLLFMLLAGITAIPGSITWVATGGSVLLTAAVITVFLAACWLLSILAVAAAFRSFDVSLDIPD